MQVQCYSIGLAMVLGGFLAQAVEPVNASSPATNSPASVPAGPRIEFAAPFFDFGELQSGKLVAHDFVFTNTGTTTLDISDVNSSCGCTAATNWDRHVEPGRTGTVHVLFNSGGMAGPIAKNLWVTSNDTNEPATMLEFVATIWKLVDAIPAQATFAFGPDFQTNETRVIRLVSHLQQPVTLSPPVSTNNAFKAALKTTQPGKEFELEVSVVPPLGPGSHVTTITVPTSAPEMPVVAVAAYAVVQPALTVTPPRIRLYLPLAEARRFVVTIRNNGTQPLKLSEPGINVEGVDVQLREVQPGKVFDLVVSFPAGFNRPSGRSVEVRLKSNHPQMPVVTIPVAPFEISDS